MSPSDVLCALSAWFLREAGVEPVRKHRGDHCGCYMEVGSEVNLTTVPRSAAAGVEAGGQQYVRLEEVDGPVRLRKSPRDGSDTESVDCTLRPESADRACTGRGRRICPARNRTHAAGLRWDVAVTRGSSLGSTRAPRRAGVHLGWGPGGEAALGTRWQRVAWSDLLTVCAPRNSLSTCQCAVCQRWDNRAHP